VTTLNCSIGALFRITTDTEILSHMNHLAVPALGESFAVEIQASEDRNSCSFLRRHD